MVDIGRGLIQSVILKNLHHILFIIIFYVITWILAEIQYNSLVDTHKILMDFNYELYSTFCNNNNFLNGMIYYLKNNTPFYCKTSHCHCRCFW